MSDTSHFMNGLEAAEAAGPSEDAVERVARAIAEEARTFSRPVNLYVEGEARERADPTFDDDSKDWDLESWKILARAAIEAMRVPTEAMEEAAQRNYGAGGDYTQIKADYQAMIDAALK